MLSMIFFRFEFRKHILHMEIAFAIMEPNPSSKFIFDFSLSFQNQKVHLEGLKNFKLDFFKEDLATL